MLAGIGAATFLGVAAPLSASADNNSLTNPAPGPSIPFGNLPNCTGANIMPQGFYLGNSNGSGLAAAAQLGWVSHPRIAVTDWASGVQAEIVPSIPCSLIGEGDSYSAYINQVFVQNVFVGGQSTQSAYNVHVWFTCTVNGQTVELNGEDPGEAFALRSGVGVGYAGRHSTGVTAAQCPLIQSARLYITTRDKDSSPVTYLGTPEMWVWQAGSWTTATGGWSPAASAAQVTPPGFENPIVCNINNSGGDIIAVTQNVVASIVAWVPCMLIPVGWDRAGKISDAWTTGPVGTLTTAFKAAVPNGIACGAVGNIPFFGRVIALDTCQADFAPGWIKTVVTYVMILGLGALAVRRIMWSVGSRG